MFMMLVDLRDAWQAFVSVSVHYRWTEEVLPAR